MKKAVIILTLTSLVYTSCENSNNTTKEKELKLRELELKQKEEVLGKQLQAKYGDGTINLEKGEFVSA